MAKTPPSNPSRVYRGAELVAFRYAKQTPEERRAAAVHAARMRWDLRYRRHHARRRDR